MKTKLQKKQKIHHISPEEERNIKEFFSDVEGILKRLSTYFVMKG
jgi:hypothetical protein